MTRHHAIALTLALLAALGGGVLLGRKLQPTSAPTDAAPAARKPLYYRNPMGLADTSPVPKKDEMGMDYIPVYAEDEAAAAPGTVALSPERIQTLGVRTEAAQLQALDAGLRASGTVVVDETRQQVIAPRFDGWVETLAANQTGMTVKRGQPLATVYSPQLLAAQEDYRVADAALRQLKQSDSASKQAMKRLRDAAKQRLLNWQISQAQLEHIAHLPPGNLTLTAPISGVVVEKPAVAGSRFVAGDTLLRLADLSRVWVMVSVPAEQSARLRRGQPASFSSPALPGRAFAGKIDFLQPTLDTATRTLGVRVALDNPDGALRPGLYGEVALAAGDPSPVLTIPRSALIDSGSRQIALVETAPGRFAPRAIQVGQRGETRIEVLGGLRAGERVVVEGNFLIDAESNLRAALQTMAPPDPHAGHDMSGHAMPAAPQPAAQPDPHAGHDMSNHAMSAAPQPAAKPDPHAGHDMSNHTMPAAPKPAAQPDPHAGHDMSGHDMSEKEH